MANTLVAIVGSTATGKSALGVRIAREIGGEIVSADSRQVYRYMDIGTGKPSAEQLSAVPHHLIDVADPRDLGTGVRVDVAHPLDLGRGLDGTSSTQLQSIQDSLGSLTQIQSTLEGLGEKDSEGVKTWIVIAIAVLITLVVSSLGLLVGARMARGRLL